MANGYPMMSKVSAIIKWAWWLAVAYLPIYFHSLEMEYLDHIGCGPYRGDCYLPGADIFFYFAPTMILLLWPVCAWHLIGKYIVRAIVRILKNEKKVQ